MPNKEDNQMPSEEQFYKRMKQLREDIIWVKNKKIEKILQLPFWTFWAKMNDLSYHDPELYMEIRQRLEELNAKPK